MENNATVPCCKTFCEAVEGKFRDPSQKANVNELLMA